MTMKKFCGFAAMTICLTLSPAILADSNNNNSANNTSSSNSGGPQQVQVVNTGAQPIPVTVTAPNPLPVAGVMADVDNPARQPVSVNFLSCTMLSGAMDGSCTTSYLVPIGKRLVIEEFSFRAAAPGGSGVHVYATLLTYLGGAGYQHRFTGEFFPTSASDETIGGRTTRLYHTGGSSPLCKIERLGPTAVQVGFECTLSGYLVDVQ
jgi:hypothetical protein